MAVYTKVTLEDANEFLDKYYDLGNLVSITEITQGVENTNYIIETNNCKYILTLYEQRVSSSDIPFFIDLLVHLDKRDIVCPKPIIMKSKRYTENLNGRHAAIFSFLYGKSTINIKNEHCSLVGQTLADIHQKTVNLDIYRDNNLSFNHWSKLYKSIKYPIKDLQNNLDKEIVKELNFLTSNWPQNLPLGIIHGDLFPDNIFFDASSLSGVIDFYFACNEFYAFDIAICINAWCFEKDNSFNITKAKHLLEGYKKFRDLSMDELYYLPILCRGSALRFLLTRIIDWQRDDKRALVIPKDPLEYFNKLRFHQSVLSVKDYGIYE
ncbi:MAG: homoserine kinase [Alphaproteobacteria bacterium]|uniref:Homoserine kinase n=1 Tax=PS1 clade bacterium TaxID=2175152 RepID=A0A368DQN0_9PROT|nr:homoserine kinase [Rhodobiaceae bacterium]OUT73517.1 MAG: homoserine kinase [Rhizobiales bacterium TMED25]RCL74129.1 MAG: homoserine kinase [PS1 clade bacterium]|tara:strand:+ start:9963 stop:10931 length:969 start_codon:yes stop_codon:yes gene_type:complete